MRFITKCFAHRAAGRTRNVPAENGSAASCRARIDAFRSQGRLRLPTETNLLQNKNRLQILSAGKRKNNRCLCERSEAIRIPEPDGTIPVQTGREPRPGVQQLFGIQPHTRAAGCCPCGGSFTYIKTYSTNAKCASLHRTLHRLFHTHRSTDAGRDCRTARKEKRL